MLHAKSRAIALVLLLTTSLMASSSLLGQVKGDDKSKKPDASANRRRALYLLDQIKELLRQEYYDKDYHGVDMAAKFKFAEQEIKKQEYASQMYLTLATALAELRDSHTAFYPPDRLERVEYGFSVMPIGNNCFVTSVKPGSDAKAQGLKEGDEIVSMAGFPVTRDTLGQIQYLIYGLQLREILKLEVRSSEGAVRSIDVKARFLSAKERKELQQSFRKEEETKPVTCQDLSSDVVACKLRTFVIEPETIDKMMKRIKGHGKLVLDLRGNRGGYIDSLTYALGYFFQQKVMVGKSIERGKLSEQWIKPQREDAFSGELAILIDANSASAAEVFARVIQIEKRGTVYGDTSAGAVMASVTYGIPVPWNFAAASNNLANYNDSFYVSLISVSVADLLMSDGGRLEGSGVVPDRRIGPNGVAIRKKSDPVMSFVAEQFGIKVSPEEAGMMHFLIPKSEDLIDDQGDVKAGN